MDLVLGRHYLLGTNLETISDDFFNKNTSTSFPKDVWFRNQVECRVIGGEMMPTIGCTKICGKGIVTSLPQGLNNDGSYEKDNY